MQKFGWSPGTDQKADGSRKRTLDSAAAAATPCVDPPAVDIVAVLVVAVGSVVVGFTITIVVVATPK